MKSSLCHILTEAARILADRSSISLRRAQDRSAGTRGGYVKSRGFTLIELLIVVVIIGILAAIAIPKFANTKEKAYVATMKSDLRNLITAQESYFADSLKYVTTTSCTNPPTAGTAAWCATQGNT